MTRGEYDAVPVGPIGRSWSVIESVLPKGVCSRCQTHWRTGVSAVRLLDRVDREEADGINRPPCHIAVNGGFGDSLGV